MLWLYQADVDHRTELWALSTSKLHGSIRHVMLLHVPSISVLLTPAAALAVALQEVLRTLAMLLQHEVSRDALIRVSGFRSVSMAH